MKSVVYVDVLLLVNFLAGYILLRAAGRLAGACAPFGRTLAAAAAAAFSTLILLAPPLHLALQLIYKLATAALVARCAFRWQGYRPYLRQIAWYFFLNLGTAGAVILGIYQFNFAGLETNNLTVYVDLSPLVLLASVVCVYLSIRVILLLFGSPVPQQFWQITLEIAGETLHLQALCDTGFFIKDPMNGRQILLVSYPAVKKQLPNAVRIFLEKCFAETVWPLPPKGVQARMVQCGTVAGGRLLPGLLAAQLTAKREAQSVQNRDVTVAFSPELLADGRFEGLFGPEFVLSTV